MHRSLLKPANKPPKNQLTSIGNKRKATKRIVKSKSTLLTTSTIAIATISTTQATSSSLSSNDHEIFQDSTLNSSPFTSSAHTLSASSSALPPGTKSTSSQSTKQSRRFQIKPSHRHKINPKHRVAASLLISQQTRHLHTRILKHVKNASGLGKNQPSYIISASPYSLSTDFEITPPPASFFETSTVSHGNPIQSFFSTLSSWASATVTTIASQTGLVATPSLHRTSFRAINTSAIRTLSTSQSTTSTTNTSRLLRSATRRTTIRNQHTKAAAQEEKEHSKTAKKPLGQLYTAGQIEHGFHVDTAEIYPSLSLAVYTFTHQRSQAQFVHIERDDSDNAFCVGFRTMPHDDTGVAHILEHTVLCGSRKFPVRDPFFLLIRKSFATFMNAMTRPEATYYPFSTQNEQDFNNLLDVYLDAVFFPLLRLHDFRQEGHRIEPLGLFEDGGDGDVNGDDGDDGDDDVSEDASEESESTGDEPGQKELLVKKPNKKSSTAHDADDTSQKTPKSHASDEPTTEEQSNHDNSTETDVVELDNKIPEKFEFKGVVFNEMKGDMSDPRSWLFGRITRHLHTTSIYRNNSGGDPIAIPNLTHQELLDFHATHYHPGNSIFMTYGNRTPVLKEANQVILDKLVDLKEKYPERCVNSSYGDSDFPPQITSTSAVSMVKNSTRFIKPRCIVEPGPTASLEDKDRPYKVSMSWLCHDNCITNVLSDSLLDFSKFDISKVESVVEFDSILAEGAQINPTHPEQIHSPNRIIQDDTEVEAIVSAAQIPKLRRSLLSALSPEEWYNTQIIDEVSSGQRLFESKVTEIQEIAQLSTRQEAIDYITTESPDLLTLIPQPKRTASQLLESTNQDVVNLLQRIKRLPLEQQESINVQFEQSSLSILSSLLFDNTYSPLYTLLSDPSLGTSPSPATGCDTWEHTPSFSMGFNGVKHGQVDLVMNKLHKALVEIAETGEGINTSTLGAILHQWEISLKDHKKQFGVNMLQRLISPFAHNQDIQHGFQIVDLLPLFKHVVETSGSLYFRTLIKHHLLSNPHRLIYVMTPDHNLAEKLQSDEQNLLADKTKTWNDADKIKCKDEAIELKQHQDADVDDSCLPSVKVSDINPKLTKYRFVTFPMGGQVYIPVPAHGTTSSSLDIDTGDFVNYNSLQRTRKQQNNSTTPTLDNVDLLTGDDKMLCTLDSTSPLTDLSVETTSRDTDITDLLSPHATTNAQALPTTTKILSRPVTFNIQPTNGIVIIRALINDVGARFTPYQLSMIPFLNLLFGRIGAAGKDYKSHSHLIDQTANDFSIQFASDDMRVETPDPSNPSTPHVEIQNTFQASIKGKCLARNVEKMCELLTESLTSQDYTEHVYNTLAQYAGGLQSAIEENSARYAMLDAQARLPNNSSGIMQNLVHGLPHVQATTTLFKKIAEDLQEYQDLQDDVSPEGSEEATKRVSPRMMRLANDIAETMRCLILGPVEQQYTHVAATNNSSPNSPDNHLTAVANANYFGPKSFPGYNQSSPTNHSHSASPSPSASASASASPPPQTHSRYTKDNVDYSKHQHDPVYPNPHVSIPQQLPLTFPFGIDRVIVTCDETTANHPQHKTSLVNGVSNLINGVYMAKPTSYKPENSLLAMYDDEGDAQIANANKDQMTQPLPPISSPQIKQHSKSTKVVPVLSVRNQYSNGSDATNVSLVDTTNDSIAPSTAAHWLQQLNSSIQPVSATSTAKYNFIAAPVQVNSVVYCEKTPINHLHPDFGAMQVLAELVNERFLHIEVREKGGAYGRFASLDRNGVFTMGSIRDPQCTRTVDAFKRALVWLRNESVTTNASVNENTTSTSANGNYTNQDLDEAKISIFGSIDAPESAGNRGLSPWLRNANHHDRELLRANMLATNLDDIARCAKLHLNFDCAVISVVGNKQKIPQEVQDDAVWTITTLDMEAPPEGTGGGEAADDSE